MRTYCADEARSGHLEDFQIEEEDGLRVMEWTSRWSLLKVIRTIEQEPRRSRAKLRFPTVPKFGLTALSYA